jgi:hypothetical protein
MAFVGHEPGTGWYFSPGACRNGGRCYVDNAKIEDAFVFADYQSPLFSGPALRF